MRCQCFFKKMANAEKQEVKCGCDLMMQPAAKDTRVESNARKLEDWMETAFEPSRKGAACQVKGDPARESEGASVQS